MAFTGYRSSKMFRGCDDPQLRGEQIRHRLSGQIIRLIGEGYDTFLSGMAEGFDMIAAEEVVRLQHDYPHIGLIAVIPFRGQCERYSHSDKERYDELLVQARERIVLSDAYHVSCFFRRNDFLVDNASQLICYYDGQSGGTRYTVQRAQRSKLSITNIADSQQAMYGDGQMPLF